MCLATSQVMRLEHSRMTGAPETGGADRPFEISVKCPVSQSSLTRRVMPRTEPGPVRHQSSKQEELEGNSALASAKDPKLAVKGPRGRCKNQRNYVLTEADLWGDWGPSGLTWGLGAAFSVDLSYSLGQETPTGLPPSPSQHPWGYPSPLTHTSHVRPAATGSGRALPFSSWDSHVFSKPQCGGGLGNLASG